MDFTINAAAPRTKGRGRERLYDLADLERYTVITAALVQFN